MYNEITHMRISYEEITCINGKAHLRFKIPKLSYIDNVVL